MINTITFSRMGIFAIFKRAKKSYFFYWPKLPTSFELSVVRSAQID